MLLLEPGHTPYDLRFSVFRIPVRVHWLFWLVSILTGGLDSKPAEVAIWVGVVFFSILVHELGHAVMFRRFGQQPRIILYSLGGLATAEPHPNSYEFHYSRPMSVRERIIVLLAGPAAGFLLAILVAIIIGVTQGTFWLRPSFPQFWRFRLGIGTPAEFENLYILVHDLMWVNIFWGLVNLVPIFPLDGGQISRELFESRNPHTGLQQSLWLSVIAGGCMVIVGILLQSFLVVLMFVLLAVQNFLILKQLRGEGWR